MVGNVPRLRKIFRYHARWEEASMKSAARIVMLGACALCATPGWPQVYPAKPVRIIVGFSAGSTTDLIGRVLATKMGDGLGQPAVVDNRPDVSCDERAMQ
jgi:hypothetical protein